MEPSELAEVTEKAHGKRERAIGLTMAVIAALLASVTLMGHRLHTEETVQQTKAADGWAFYQAKNGRYHMYAADAKLAELVGPQGASVAKEWRKKAEEEKADAENIRHENEKLDEETHTIARRATFFDASEICLEVAIVLCSVALLTGTLLFWRISFLGAVIGVAVAAMGFLKGEPHTFSCHRSGRSGARTCKMCARQRSCRSGIRSKASTCRCSSASPPV